jgi:hypothetical protein
VSEGSERCGDLRDDEIVDVEDVTLSSGVGDHGRVVAMYLTGPTEEESSRTHLVPPSHHLNLCLGVSGHRHRE